VGVPALRIVEVLDVVADGGRRDNSTGVDAPTNQLGLQRAEEALDDCIVVAVTRAAHARDNTILTEDGRVCKGCVRAATVGVMQETSFVGSRRKARESEQPGLTE